MQVTTESTDRNPGKIKRHLSPLHAMLSMLEMQMDAGRLNEILNHPDVHPWVANRDEPLDMSEAVGRPGVIVLLAKHGGVLFHMHQPGLWEAHTQILPKGRGEWGKVAVEACLHWMFCRTDAMEIVTRCPQGNIAAKALARAIGGTFQFTNSLGWIKDGKPIPADIYSLNVVDWMRRAPGLVERGQWFHRRLDDEFKTFHQAPPPHAEDGVHDRYVGAACEMYLGDQPAKATVLYNRWAIMAGYLPITVASLVPLTIDIGTALLVVRDDDLKVMAVAPKH